MTKDVNKNKIIDAEYEVIDDNSSETDENTESPWVSVIAVVGSLALIKVWHMIEKGYISF